MDDKFTCEICLECVNNYEPHIRIGADTVLRDQHGSYCSLMSNRVMVFAVFHTECLANANNSDYDEVGYIDEARELVNVLGEDERVQDNRIVMTRSGYLA
jgi:hypothetical protein